MNNITYVYRAYNGLNELCYVGLTNNFDIRIRSHRLDKDWWRTEVSTIKVKTFDSRSEAETEESKAIALEFPKYNELKGRETPSSLADSEELARLSIFKTKKPLPSSEIEYLKTLSEPEVYQRAAALQDAGWPVTQILLGVRVAPTPIQLRTSIKLTKLRDTSRPVPKPPLTRTEKKALKEASIVHLNLSQKRRLIYLSKQVKKYRPGHLPGHPIFEAREEYNSLISYLYHSGVSVAEMAQTVNVDESNIRRRIT